eukprot:4575245-Pyramimonas_sp.AAC.1
MRYDVLEGSTAKSRWHLANMFSIAAASYTGFSQKDLPDHSLPGLWASSARDHPPGSMALPVMLSPSP